MAFEQFAFLILVRGKLDSQFWESGEGPFVSIDEARRFAEAEVGAEYVIVQVVHVPVV